MSTLPAVKPLEPTPAAPNAHVVQTKTYPWTPPLHRGDCEQDNGQISFHSDGTGTFSCTTLTYHTHSGDVWHASFSAIAKNGAVLFTTPTFNSPRMNDGNPPPRYPWSAQFTFLAEQWDAIGSATQHCSC